MTKKLDPAPGDIRALKHRIHELEGEVIGYKRILDEQAAQALNKQLLEALKDTLEMLEAYCGEYEQATRNKARAAIAAVEGTI